MLDLSWNNGRLGRRRNNGQRCVRLNIIIDGFGFNEGNRMTSEWLITREIGISMRKDNSMDKGIWGTIGWPTLKRLSSRKCGSPILGKSLLTTIFEEGGSVIFRRISSVGRIDRGGLIFRGKPSSLLSKISSFSEIWLVLVVVSEVFKVLVSSKSNLV